MQQNILKTSSGPNTQPKDSYVLLRFGGPSKYQDSDQHRENKWTNVGPNLDFLEDHQTYTKYCSKNDRLVTIYVCIAAVILKLTHWNWSVTSSVSIGQYKKDFVKLHFLRLASQLKYVKIVMWVVGQVGACVIFILFYLWCKL